MRISVFLAIVLMFSICFSESISLGTLQKTNKIYVEQNSVANAKILVWNSGKDPIFLTLEVLQIPKGWQVEINPNNFWIDSNFSEFEVIVIEGKSYFAIPINIYFKSSSDSENGVCIIRAYAKSNPGQISVYQVRDFYFYLSTDKNATKIEQTLELPNKTSNETELPKIDSELKQNSEKPDNNAIKIILISTIIAILIIILRKLSEKSDSRTISLRHFAR